MAVIEHYLLWLVLNARFLNLRLDASLNSFRTGHDFTQLDFSRPKLQYSILTHFSLVLPTNIILACLIDE